MYSLIPTIVYVFSFMLLMESVDCKDDKRVNAQESSVVSVDTNGIFFLLDYNTRYYYSN